MFEFVITDLHTNINPRIKQNNSIPSYAEGMLVLTKAHHEKLKSISEAIKDDNAVGYWKLNDNIGSKIAPNLGNKKSHLNGSISRDIKVAQSGFALNDGILGSKCMFFQPNILTDEIKNDENLVNENESKDAFISENSSSNTLLSETINSKVYRDDSKNKIKLQTIKKIKSPAIEIPYDNDIALKEVDHPFSIEAIACTTGGTGTNRTVVMTGK